MASPDHKAGLAVVVPNSDNRSQARGKVKQNIFSTPRKSTCPSASMSTGRQAHGSPTAPRISNRPASVQQPNGSPPIKPSNRFLPGQVSNGASPKQPNGVGYQQSNIVAPCQLIGAVSQPLKGGVPARPRLLGVDEALKYSPFSSIVPFSSGWPYTNFGNCQALILQISYLLHMPNFKAHNHSFQRYRSSVRQDNL